MAKRNRKRSSVRQLSYLPTNTVSVIIPVHRRLDLLKKCLEALPEAFENIKYDVILVDNNTPSEEKATLYPLLKATNACRIYERTENAGFSKACNFGAAKTNSPFLFFLDTDVILSAGCMNNMLALFNDPHVGIAGMKLLFPKSVEEEKLRPDIRPSYKIQHVAVAINVRGETINVLSGWSANHPKVMNIHDAHMVCGSALMIRKNLFHQAGGFYEGYGLGSYEDYDLCLSIRQMGYNIVVDPTVYAVHYTNATVETYKIALPVNENKFLFMQRWASRFVMSDWLYW